MGETNENDSCRNLGKLRHHYIPDASDEEKEITTLDELYSISESGYEKIAKGGPVGQVKDLYLLDSEKLNKTAIKLDDNHVSEEKTKGEDPNSIKTTRKYRRSFVNVKDEWFKKVDSNCDPVNVYLRPVKDDPSRVFCAADKTQILCKWRGFGAIQVRKLNGLYIIITPLSRTTFQLLHT